MADGATPPLQLRLVADDLTGALDTAAQFVVRTGKVPVRWNLQAGPGSVAIDSGMREQDEAANMAAAIRLATLLAPAPGRIAFWKLDSLLRGHCGAALAALLRALPAGRCIIAPAFPFQGRVTRGGRQFARTPAGWQCVGEAFTERLRRDGLALTLARPGEAVPEGTSFWDAETDADLQCIAAAGLALAEPPLWCGTSGLAGALAGPQPPSPGLAPPVLGLFGSDHAVTTAQLAAAPCHLRLPDGGPAAAALLAAGLQADGAVLASFALPPATPRPQAALAIARAMAALTARLPPPRTLLVSGGETLRALCTGLGATHLEVTGQVMPGVPRSRLCGGRWDGVDVVSKSGAFGPPDLLRHLLGAALEQREGSRA